MSCALPHLSGFVLPVAIVAGVHYTASNGSFS
jgi:hypothetical protein